MQKHHHAVNKPNKARKKVRVKEVNIQNNQWQQLYRCEAKKTTKKKGGEQGKGGRRSFHIVSNEGPLQAQSLSLKFFPESQTHGSPNSNPIAALLTASPFSEGNSIGPTLGFDHEIFEQLRLLRRHSTIAY